MNFYGLPEFMSYGILVGIAVVLIRQQLGGHLKYWLTGWVVILAHAGIFMLVIPGFIQDVAGRGLLALAGLAFMGAAHYQRSVIETPKLVGQLLRVGLPNLVFAITSTAYVERNPDGHAFGLFAALIAVGAACAIWQVLDKRDAQRQSRFLVELICVAYGVQAWLLYSYGVLMASQWLMCWTYLAVAFFFVRQARALTVGTALTALSFVLWGLVFPVYSLLLIHAPDSASHIQGMVWNLPKFLTAACMILVLLEEKVARVTSITMTQKKLLSILEDKNEQLVRADMAKDHFLAIMSHELRTPMTGVLGMADRLMNSGLSDKQEKNMRVLTGAARTMLTLLNDILDFSKIEAGELQIERAPFLLSEAIFDVRDLYAGSASAKGLVLKTNMPSTFQDAVVGDATRLKQVLSNLISNAIKFTAKGHIAIAVEQDVSPTNQFLCRISVTDTGMGIPQHAIDRLFQPYVQADASMARKFGGTGLGLSICRSLVRGMGGEIAVTSKEGEGSTFSFSVKLDVDRGREATAPSVNQPSIDGAIDSVRRDAARRPLNILIAEDDELLQIVISAILEDNGHSVKIVGDGKAAVEAATAESYDIILMDMHMPIMDGPDAIRMVKQWEQSSNGRVRTPIIALTADVRGKGGQDYLEAGAESFVGKPIDATILLSEIEKLALLRPREGQ
ncbi:MAG TPA: ATP-binding protein [Magnetospirillaceae bacterium]|jgi:signal transduction histidine kinase/ActR/RegA family two-component response regulator